MQLIQGKSIDALTHSQLLHKARMAAHAERKATAALLEVLVPIYKKEIYVAQGHGSFFTFVEKFLGYSGGSANRWVNAVKATTDLPEIKKKVENGRLSLSSASCLGDFFKKERFEAKKRLSSNEKREILSSIENQTERRTKEILGDKSSVPEKCVKYREKVINSNRVRMEFDVSKEFYQEIEELKNILSNALGMATTADLFRYCVRDLLKRKSPFSKLYKSARKNRLSRKTTETSGDQVPKLPRQRRCVYENLFEDG